MIAVPVLYTRLASREQQNNNFARGRVK